MGYVKPRNVHDMISALNATKKKKKTRKLIKENYKEAIKGDPIISGKAFLISLAITAIFCGYIYYDEIVNYILNSLKNVS